VKFQDVYQHLDKLHLYSQEPALHIEEAGDFRTDFTFTPPQQLPAEIQNIKNDGKGYEELYQHIRFKMPSGSLTLDLKWEERLFAVEYDIRPEFFELSTIKDTNRREDITKTPECQVLTRKANFPYYTYPVTETGRIMTPLPPSPVESDVPPDRVIRNSITISSTLKKYIIIKEKISYYKIGNFEKIKFRKDNSNDTSLNMTRDDAIGSPNHIQLIGGRIEDSLPSNDRLHYEFKQPNLFFDFYMPKNNVKITLNAGVPINWYKKFIDYERGDIVLNPGRYKVGIRAGDGGNSLPNCGQNGGEYHDIFEINELTIFTYMVGLNGGDGMPASGGSGALGGSGGAGGGGAGGGGSSIFLLSNPPVSGLSGKQSVYCIGGSGVNGENGGRGGLFGGNEGGRGGAGGLGGGWDSTADGDGKDGTAGTGGESGVIGSSYAQSGAAQGAGGLGWGLDNVKKNNVITGLYIGPGAWRYVSPLDYYFLGIRADAHPGSVEIKCLEEFED
jgi:hypothetical protein